MAYSVNTLLNDISGVVHGTTTNKIPNIYGIINRAARALLLDVDPKETQRIVQLGQVFNSTYDYAIPVDVKGDKLIDIRPQANRYPFEQWQQTYAEIFDTQKGFDFSNMVYTQWNTGVKSLRIAAPELTSPVTITDTSTLTGWSADPDATNLTLDNTFNVAGGGALVFDLPGGTLEGAVENSTLFPVDLSSQEKISTLFLWIFCPSGAATTRITLRFGSSASDFWQLDATNTQQGTAFVDGWNLVSFTWANATTTGTPDSSSISYCKFFVDYTTPMVGFKIDNLTSTLGTYFELQYYSKFLFRDPATNVFQETINNSLDNSKIINLDTDSYNLLFNKVAFYVAQSLQGADAEYDADYWQSEYNEALARYRASNPTEIKKKANSYYALPQKSYNRFQSNFYR